MNVHSFRPEAPQRRTPPPKNVGSNAGGRGEGREAENNLKPNFFLEQRLVENRPGRNGRQAPRGRVWYWPL
ncbi:MAG: hypothetical protein KGQ94_10130, partial [Alphaproteobacteria bacterium]|nr:hypothetical protein [Alphaproteobacteria bacterium]